MERAGAIGDRNGVFHTHIFSNLTLELGDAFPLYKKSRLQRISYSLNVRLVYGRRT